MASIANPRDTDWAETALARVRAIAKELCLYRQAVHEIKDQSQKDLELQKETMRKSIAGAEHRVRILVLELRSLERDHQTLVKSFAKEIQGYLKIEAISEPATSLLDRVMQNRERVLMEQLRFFEERVPKIKIDYEVRLKDIQDQIDQKNLLRQEYSQMARELESKMITFEHEHRDKTGAQLAALKTPEIQKLLDESTAIIAAWNNGHGQTCDNCGNILHLSVWGILDDHNDDYWAPAYRCPPPRH